MDLMPLRVFQRQIAVQCEFAIIAEADLKAGLSAGDQTKVFAALQSLLNAIANISKALWTQGGNRAHLRKNLRESLGVSDDSPLRPTRFRNHFEHFDERIDEWWADSSSHNCVDFNFGPVDGITSEKKDVFRNFDPHTGKAIFWGDEFDVNAIMAEARQLHARATEEAAKPHFEVSERPCRTS